MSSQTEPGESLSTLAKEYWEARLAEEPILATSIGDRRYDDMLRDITPEGRLEVQKQYESMLQRCRSISADALSDADRLTLTALLVDARAQLDYLSCGLDDWTVDPLDGPQVQFLNIESFQPVRSVEEGLAMVDRWRSMGQFLDDHMANLRRGSGEGKVAVGALVQKVIEETEDLLAKHNEEWAFVRPAAVAREDWSTADHIRFKSGVTAAAQKSIRPAFARYLEFLNSEIMPRARPQDRPGMLHVPGGLEAYSRLIRVHTSLDLTTDELHQTGLKEVARINGEMVELGEKVFGTRDRMQVLQRLRTDPALYFSSRDEVAAKAEAALSKAKAAIPKWFGRLPKADCEVVRMEEHEEKHSTIAYYRQPAADGSRPGRYYINTSAPETRPRYEAEALAYHESIPGHHLQLAIAQELEGIPEFRKHSGVTAFVEGWGLYSERLSDEMGLYSSDLDRIGVLSFDSWRACRLVVDTGMHAMGWTRSQAIDFMLENSALAKNNIVNEVDRYIAWPGQALAYKTGQLEMTRLRQDATARLGGRFDVRKFHDALLCNGALPLEALRQVIHDHVESGLR
ncbi:MAG: DUF885 domain-containing protein [Nitrososphaerales archaeon]|jgi:uncharacterized protein (DUF885 family)